MSPDEYEIVGKHFHWIRATAEIEDIRNGTRRPETDYAAKVDVFDDRVTWWFLGIAQEQVAHGPSPGDYVALSIALAHIEGLEQYRQGRSTKGNSGDSFKTGIQEVFRAATEDAVERLWDAARCGLFHDGFTRGRTVVSHGAPDALSVVNGYLRINPALFVSGVMQNFNGYVRLLRDEPTSGHATKFVAVWDAQWNAT